MLLQTNGRFLRRLLFCCLFICCNLPAARALTAPVPIWLSSREKSFYLYDDGPNAHADTTARLIDVLAKHNIHGVFALLGINAERNPDLVRRIYDEGHVIVNHGYGEKWAVNLNAAEFREYLLRAESVIASALNMHALNTNTPGANAPYPLPKIYRPQGGFYKKCTARYGKNTAIL